MVFSPILCYFTFHPNKLLGVIALVASIITLLLLPFVDRPLLRSSIFKPFVSNLNILFVANCIVLGYIGQSPLEEPFLTLGKLSTLFFFVYFVMIKIAGLMDKFMISYLKSEEKILL
jgi:ubiquinol-cytochrome c reductase cytochrome b subunit